jgi:hypothetical protein
MQTTGSFPYIKTFNGLTKYSRQVTRTDALLSLDHSMGATGLTVFDIHDGERSPNLKKTRRKDNENLE